MVLRISPRFQRRVASCAAVFSVSPQTGESVGATLKTAAQEAKRRGKADDPRSKGPRYLNQRSENKKSWSFPISYPEPSSFLLRMLDENEELWKGLVQKVRK